MSASLKDAGVRAPELAPPQLTPEPQLPAVVESRPRAVPPRIYPPKIAKAILAVTREIGHIQKNGWNDFQNYAYPKWEDIKEKLSPLLAEHGLIPLQNEKTRHLIEQNDKGSMLSIVYEFSFTNEDGDTWPPIEWTALARLRDQKGISDDKAAAKCHTQAEKYFCIKQFKIRTADAIDSDADDGRGVGAKPAAPSADREDVPAVVRRVNSIVPARIQRNLDRIAPKPHPDSFPPSAAERFATRPARTVVPAKPGGIADRAMVARAHQSWARPAGPTKAFFAADAGKREGEGFDERNPPPHEDIPDHAAGKALNRELHPMNDRLPGDLAPDREPHRAMLRDVMKPLPDPDIPEFLQRKLQSDEPTYVDLVEGGMIPAVPASKS
jgi:hypothetical protein